MSRQCCNAAIGCQRVPCNQAVKVPLQDPDGDVYVRCSLEQHVPKRSPAAPSFRGYFERRAADAFGQVNARQRVCFGHQFEHAEEPPFNFCAPDAAVACTVLRKVPPLDCVCVEINPVLLPPVRVLQQTCMDFDSEGGQTGPCRCHRCRAQFLERLLQVFGKRVKRHFRGVVKLLLCRRLKVKKGVHF